MGRPPMKAADRRTHCVMVRLTPAEYRRLSDEAKAAGVPLALYIMGPWRSEG
jgi:hypothetical protein